MYKNCQSCGMPHKHEANSGGTNTDGTKSDKYCSNCYQDGMFTLPDLTAGQMKAQVKRRLKIIGFSVLFIRFFTIDISKLERWKKTEGGFY